MNDDDKPQFQHMFDSLAECYQKPSLTPTALQMFFSALSRYSIEQIEAAIQMHLQNPDAGRFFPKPADICSYLQPSKPTLEQVIAFARNADTPFGIMCRVQIGSYDLDNGTSHCLRQRAEECIARMPEWLGRASRGEFTDPELRAMHKYKVNPRSAFLPGLQAPVLTLDLHAKLDDKIKKLELH